MYADRYGSTGIKPGALSVAIGLNGAILGALIFSAPKIINIIPDPPIETYNVKEKPLPPLEKVKPEIKPKTSIDQRVVTPPPPQRPDVFDSPRPDAGGYTVDPGLAGLDTGATGGTGTVITPPLPPHVAVLAGAQVDARYAGALQPAYPPGERRLGNEGRVTVRVLVGVDGRVKQVELVSAASDQFFAATRKQALEKWRFKPATRDGVPEESWRTMSVRFVLDEER